MLVIPAASERLHTRLILAVARELLTHSGELNVNESWMEQKRQCQRDRGAGYKNRVSLSSVQAAHEQHTPVHTCWSVCGCTAEPPSTLQRLWLASVTWQLWNFFTGNPQQRWEKQKYSLVSTFMPYTIRKFSLLLLWTAVRGHSLESLWHTDVPRDATGSSRSLGGQCAPHTSKGLNPTQQVYFSFYKNNWKNLTIIMIFSILAVLYFEEIL